MAATNIDLGSEMQSLQDDTKVAEQLLDGLEKRIKSMSKALANLLGGISPASILGEAEKTVKRTTTTVRKETKKAMAAFDEVERIDTADTTTTVTQSVTTSTTEVPKSAGAAQGTTKVDLTPETTATGKLGLNIGDLQTKLSSSLPLWAQWADAGIGSCADILTSMQMLFGDDFLSKMAGGLGKAGGAVLNAFKGIGTWIGSSFAPMVSSGIGKAGSAFSSIGSWIATGAKAVGQGFLNIGSSIGKAVSAAGSAFSSIGSWIATGAKTVVQGFVNIGSAIGKAVSAAGSAFSSIGSWIATGAKTVVQGFVNIGSAIGNAVSSAGRLALQVGLNAAAWVKETAVKAASTVATWAQVAATTAWNALCTVATAVTTAFGAAIQFLTSPIGLVILAIGALIAIVVLLVKNWDTVKTAVINAWNAVTEALSPAAQWLNEHVLQPVVGFFTSVFGQVSAFLKGVFTKDWTEQFGAFGNILNAFFLNVQGIWTGIKGIFTGIINFVKNVFTGNWRGAWDGIVQVFKGIWDYLVAVVKAPINSIIGMINALVGGVVSGINVVIRALNRLKIDIPKWVPGLGGQKFGFDITPLNAPKIPLLAQGAVLPANKPFMAVVGDQKHGTNIEAPISLIKQALAEVMAAQGGSDVVINFTGDLAQLGRVLKPVIDRENRRVGGSLVKGVV